MSVYSALSPISVGIYQALNVPALTALAPGGVHDYRPQNPTYPYVFYSVSDENNSAFGGRPGTGPGSMVTIRLRISVYSAYAGMKEAQAVVAKVTELLTLPPTAAGYAVWTIWKQPAIPVTEDLVAGVIIRELAGEWTLDVEEAA